MKTSIENKRTSMRGTKVTSSFDMLIGLNFDGHGPEKKDTVGALIKKLQELNAPDAKVCIDHGSRVNSGRDSLVILFEGTRDATPAELVKAAKAEARSKAEQDAAQRQMDKQAKAVSKAKLLKDIQHFEHILAQSLDEEESFMVINHIHGLRTKLANL